MRRARGFTLLETVIALAILGLALMAIFDLNAGAVANHAYTKKLTVATLLARSKMTDLEQKLYDDGFSNDDDEESGDFSDEGWSTFKWRAKIIAPTAYCSSASLSSISARVIAQRSASFQCSARECTLIRPLMAAMFLGSALTCAS